MSLNTRLLFALLGLPLLVYAIMAFLLVFHADATGRTVLEERLVSTAELLAPSLGEAMADGDSQRLERLAGKLLEQRNLRAVTLFDEQGNRLLVMGSSLPPSARLHAPEATTLSMEDDLWRVQTPLTSESLSGRGRTQNGWLEAEMDSRTLVLERYKLIASLSLGGMLLGLLLFLIAFAISRYATRPIEEASQALYRLSRGDDRLQITPPGPSSCTSWQSISTDWPSTCNTHGAICRSRSNKRPVNSRSPWRLSKSRISSSIWRTAAP